MTELMQEASASSQTIFEIVSKIESVLLGEKRSDVVIACLSIALTLQEPDITAQQLHDGVSGASKWMCLFLSGDDPNQLPKALLN